METRDSQGQTIKVGDVVLVPCVVADIAHPDEKAYGNMTLRTVGVEKAGPRSVGDPRVRFDLNSRQVTKQPPPAKK